ncbi:Glycine cleavage system transcriptional repressor [BD1-7 clade bacterium]|uniref:Glycine cleavage system transcriptional repressor n=1 Tax=BD1-7 clade bacterium TaxID=2029982 RepID=A0A5S9R074_9GAMM|nr:Glycine cleavage system transcriptional repressor [BD1-7 clade bacterium]
MQQALVFTFIGNDKPGIVERLSNLVASHGGNWLESRMTKLGGKFTGVVQISVDQDKVEDVKKALNDATSDELAILLESGTHDVEQPAHKTIKLSIIGLDRAGIVREIAQGLIQHGFNVIDMHTLTESAPMAGNLLFKAEVTVDTRSDVDMEKFSEDIEDICNTLDIDWNLEEIR